MKDFLNHNQIEYILFHLKFLLETDDRIRKSMVFLKSPHETENYNGKIIFILSNDEYQSEKIKWVNDIPILFPVSQEKDFFSIESGNIVFRDDLLKSAFFLLSGYQEYNSNAKDQFNRFPYSASVQNQLNSVEKPLVNYYFLEIIKGIKQFCSLHDIPFKKQRKDIPLTFVLSHDIDKIEKYNWSYIGYKIKELAFMVKRQKSWLRTLRLFLISLLGVLRLVRDKNPYWSFKYIQDLNRNLGFKSTYYFLPRDQKNTDADYDLNEKRVLNLFEELKMGGNEIGTHGTVASSLSGERAKENKDLLESILMMQIQGIRQHRLCYELPVTTRIHEDSGYVYDNSLGFAEHIGFRNSYCLPFRLYDFENDRMFQHWQIPLTVMDVTLFAYQKYNTFEAEEAIKKIITEVKKFNGLFTLLWHNTQLDENEFKGIRGFYKSILEYIAEEGCISTTASGALELLVSEN